MKARWARQYWGAPEGEEPAAGVIAEATRRHLEALILVNNRLEGNAPATVRALATALAGGEEQTLP